MLCKLDVEKAFNPVCWHFLIYMLQQCDFSEKWRKWIMFCISTMHFSILINGSLSGFIIAIWGLRYGDSFPDVIWHSDGGF